MYNQYSIKCSSSKLSIGIFCMKKINFFPLYELQSQCSLEKSSELISLCIHFFMKNQKYLEFQFD